MKREWFVQCGHIPEGCCPSCLAAAPALAKANTLTARRRRKYFATHGTLVGFQDRQETRVILSKNPR